MGVSIVLHRVSPAENFEELKTLEADLEKAEPSKVDLYKMTGDLYMVFANDEDAFSNDEIIPFKMLFGKHIEETVGDRQIGGFLPSSQVKEVVDWIKQNEIETAAGFSKMHDNLSEAVKEELENWGSPEKDELFDGYVKPLVEFYFTALLENNSIVVTGE